MRKIFIVLVFPFLVLSLSVINAQQLEINLETDKNEYISNDSIFVMYKIKNVSGDTILFLDMGRFQVKEHCFSAYKYGEELYYNDNNEHELNDFHVIMPGEEITVKNLLSIHWLCRSMAPREDWNIALFYILEVTQSDNYYTAIKANLEKTRIPVEAWTGMVSSNSASFVIKKPGW